MREYWINVYEEKCGNVPWRTKLEAEKASEKFFITLGRTLYRIHVRIK